VAFWRERHVESSTREAGGVSADLFSGRWLRITFVRQHHVEAGAALRRKRLSSQFRQVLRSTPWRQLPVHQ